MSQVHVMVLSLWFSHRSLFYDMVFGNSPSSLLYRLEVAGWFSKLPLCSITVCHATGLTSLGSKICCIVSIQVDVCHL